MSTTSATIQIPSDAEAPVVAAFHEHALHVALVNRVHLAALSSDSWDATGVYVLLTNDGSGHAYVGQARKIRTRLMQHHSNPKLPWRRAVAIKRDTTDGFNTAEIGYLEGRLSAELAALPTVTVIEGKKSGDDTLGKEMTSHLDAFVKSILGALRLAGIDTKRADPESEEEEDVTSAPSGQPGRATYSVTLGDLVSSGLIQAGQALYLRQATTEAMASVTAAGEIVHGGVSYRSPSTAAAKALGLQSSNGWTSWRVGSFTGETLDHFRKQWMAQHEA